MADALLLEDGSGRLLLEDGSGVLLLETTSVVLGAEADVALGPFLAFAAFNVFDLFGLTANVSMRPFPGAAVLDLFRNAVVDAAVRMGTFTAPSRISLSPLTGWVQYAEQQHPALLGDIDITTGPGGCLLVSASKSCAIAFVQVFDSKTVYVSHSRRFSKQPMAVASTESYYFVLLAGTTKPDPEGAPELLVFPQTSFFADPVASLTLPRGIQPRFLWAGGDGPDLSAGFLVLTGDDGAIQVRRADPTLELLAEVGTGVYTPRVVEVVRQPDLEKSQPGVFEEKVWNILVFSERSARGYVLQYKEQELTTTYVRPEDVNLYSLAALGAFAAAADLEANPV
jgi:hypothetical protein